ncbi:aspartyl-phosphate phosphatase Spo0E family protein [Metabacillus fastidiosus]|uniref:Aspartyl-phosphate phosphatase Spo0E family protein n=1 Tax=Metabacillus fastidiosus TaxID=1458 RepID=A0ABU6NZC9_9BACI|nr:aspartyl-phosphate phosphatase Spo0E family protein [Metabacillus fastidiosus]MED4402477.1 aspartyl-phosphate phosphatase Spo0E family protein [Metabacillus fastidiosus]MED4453828.1 aspartyl-phosphate phosphatase Spo0E family protein [Metabacillus fastidiosus]MED4461764.1 aspartyl-phosphate phosphatase Spo0E family protein [Metabacillus fastidiosus]
MKIQNMTLNELENDIQSLRSRMITTGMQKGLNHPDSIKYSQQLDVLLNKYQRLKSYKNQL